LILKEEIREENIKKIDVKPATKVWLFKRASCPVQVAGLTRIGWQLSPKFASRSFENQNKTKKTKIIKTCIFLHPVPRNLDRHSWESSVIRP